MMKLSMKKYKKMFSFKQMCLYEIVKCTSYFCLTICLEANMYFIIFVFVVVVLFIVDYFHTEKLYTFAKEIKNMKLFIFGRFVSLNTGNATILAFVTARD